jgi:hypothetical protein
MTLVFLFLSSEKRTESSLKGTEMIVTQKDKDNGTSFTERRRKKKGSS